MNQSTRRTIYDLVASIAIGIGTMFVAGFLILAGFFILGVISQNFDGQVLRSLPPAVLILASLSGIAVGYFEYARRSNAR